MEDRVTKEPISTDRAPAAVGPYNQAVVAGSTVYCAGQLGFDPATGELVEGIEGQTERALANLSAVLGAAGASLADVVKTTCFLGDINDFAAFNAVYARIMPQPFPARSTFQVGKLPRGGLVEIEAIAERPSGG
jgi:2-iminobutanoate/2-iminopropanoate deaminase